MAVSVSQTVRGSGQTGVTTPTITIPTAPAAGEVVYVVVGVLAGSTRSITSVSGLGATWTVATTPNVGIAVGTGATGSGTVTVTMDTSSDYKLDAYVVAGLSNPTAVDWSSSAGNLSGTGPTLLARDGQFVLQMAAVIPGSVTLTDGTAVAPTTGWTVGASAGTSGGVAASATRLPTETAWTTHRVDYTAPSMSGNASTLAALGSKSGQIALRGKTLRRYPGSPTQNSTVAIPDTVQVGDLMVLSVTWYDNITTPTGWTLQGKVAFITTPNPAAYVFTKVAASGDTGGGKTVALNGTAPTNGGSAALLAYAGVGSVTFSINAQTTTSPATMPSRTLTDAGSVFLYGTNMYYSGGTGESLSMVSTTGQNVRGGIDYTGSNPTPFFALAVAEESPGATGATGTRSSSWVGTYAAGWSMELVPAAGGTTPQTIAVGRATATATASAITRALLPQSRAVGMASTSVAARATQVVMFGKVLLLDPGQPVPDGTPVGTLIFRKA